MAPNPRPIPRFIADTHPGGDPARALRRAAGEALPRGGRRDRGPARRARALPDEIDWFPERAWGGRVWVPCSRPQPRATRARWSCSATSPTCSRRAGDPADFQAKADFTDVLAEDNPDWRIDLNDDVIGRWRGENGRAGAVTLVWGRPLVRGAVAATAELDGETVDQEEISQDRFTLIALDALEGYGDEIFMEVKLWSRRAQELASESLYGLSRSRQGPQPRPAVPAPLASRASKVTSGAPAARPERRRGRRRS